MSFDNIIMRKLNCIVSWSLAVALLPLSSQIVIAQVEWRLDARSNTGPTAQVALSANGERRRTAFVAFEYARRCDPLFAFIEATGTQLGTPIEQSVLKGSKIGIVLNGKFHTWHAATTRYSNGYEAAFAVTNDLFELLVGDVRTLVFITPSGEHVPVPTGGIQNALKGALGVCAKRFG